MTTAKVQSSFVEFPPLPCLDSEMLLLSGAAADYAAQIKAWTTYTQYFAGAAGVVRLADSIVRKSVKDADLYSKLHGGFRAVYDALSGVNKQFIAGIESMRGGKAPSYDFDPAPVPDWSDDPTQTGVFTAAWQSIKPVLEMLLNKMPDGGTLAAAVAGLLGAGDKCVADLEKAFGKK